jgi:hypothetical protein
VCAAGNSERPLPGTNGRNFKILQSRVQPEYWNVADRFKSVWESLISILLDGNTEAAFSAELVTAVSTEIGMGFVPISICWHAMNNNLIPGVALRAVLFKGTGNFVWIVAHRCSPSF